MPFDFSDISWGNVFVLKLPVITYPNRLEGW
jgi:hypothetical protein